MWEVIGFAGVIAALGSVGWLLTRLITRAQGGDRSYSGDDSGPAIGGGCSGGGGA